MSAPHTPESKPSLWGRLREVLGQCELAGKQHVFYRHPLIVAAGLLFLGIQFAQFLDLGSVSVVLFVTIPICVCVALWLSWSAHARWKWLCAFALIFQVGVAVSEFQRSPEEDDLSRFATRASQPIVFRGTVASAASWSPNPNHRPLDPRSEPWRTRWDLQLTEVRDTATWKPVQCRSTLVVDGRIDDLLPGDEIEVHGEYRRVFSVTNPGSFDFATHARREGVFIGCKAEGRQQIEIVGLSQTHRLRRIRGIAVRYVDSVLHRHIWEEHASLAAALVFGQREQVDWQQQQELMATGTLHLLAISGLHVELVAATILFCCVVAGASNRTTFLVLCLICVAYASLAGGKPPVVRAVIIVLAFSWARVAGRTARIGNVLGLAALLLLAWRVSSFQNVGVQLSFLAVGTIAVFVRGREPGETLADALGKVVASESSFLRRWATLIWKWLVDGTKLSGWVWLLTCPLVWTQFHVVAPISVLLNVLVSIPLVVSLLSGIATALVGPIPILGSLLGSICSAGLAVVQAIVGVGVRVPLGHLWLPAPSVIWVVVFYGVAAVWLVVFGTRKNRWLATILVALLVGGVGLKCVGKRGYIAETSPLWATNTDVEQCLKCTFLDVGHGTCVVLEMPNGQVWMYDAGHMGAAERSHEAVAAALWELPTARIHKLIVSHADSDHYNAVGGLLPRFAIAEIVSTPQFWASEDLPVKDLLAEVSNRRVSQVNMAAPQSGSVGSVEWRVLHPKSNWTGQSDNADSLCLLVEYGGRRILLPGDLERDGLLGLVQMPPRPCDILMAPHHGSSALDPTDLLQWCRPTWTVISGNHRAMRPKVLQQYEGRTSNLAVTFRDAAIQFCVYADGRIEALRFSGAEWVPFDH